MPSELGSKLYSDREETGDVTFIVGSTHIKAHRNVLAALSPKYKAQFYGSRPDKDNVNVVGVEPAVFAEFVKFFYLDNADVTIDNVAEILNLAKESLFDRLSTECESLICKLMNAKNVCKFYELALLLDLKDVKNICELKIGEEYVPSLFMGDDFLSIDLDTLLSILDIDILNCTEVEVFEGCIRWAAALRSLDGLCDVKGKDLRAELDGALSKIRFKSMALNDFVNLYEKYQGFFSAEEYVKITQTIMGHSTHSNINQSLRKTRIKFRPVVIENCTQEKGVNKIISCVLNNISSMEEFKDQSSDELRFDYYRLLSKEM
ncbi:hypothetical protein HA402_000645 [Bradysia odoriphaga]|nr:hypothetical protein HA402_000645 [Bradysia odoriphaga]